MEKITEKGVLKYRMPNVLEVYDLLDASGVNSGIVDTLKIKRNVIAEMKSLVNYSEISEVSSYEGLLELSDEMTMPLSEIADEVIGKIFEVFKKKN
jgi:hypothetical protein